MTSNSSDLPSAPDSASVWDELSVPDEQGVWFCARHKKVKTRLRCGRCEKPICPKCVVMAPTGARCRDCASNRGSHIYQVPPLVGALCFGAAMLAGAFGALIVSRAGMLAIFALLYAPAIGPLLGRMITRISGGKRGPKIAFISIAGLLLGVAATAFFTDSYTDPILWLMALIGVAGVWNWLK